MHENNKKQIRALCFYHCLTASEKYFKSQTVDEEESETDLSEEEKEEEKKKVPKKVVKGNTVREITSENRIPYHRDHIDSIFEEEVKTSQIDSILKVVFLQLDKTREDYKKITDRLDGRIKQLENIMNGFLNKIIGIERKVKQRKPKGRKSGSKSQRKTPSHQTRRSRRRHNSEESEDDDEGNDFDEDEDSMEEEEDENEESESQGEADQRHHRYSRRSNI